MEKGYSMCENKTKKTFGTLPPLALRGYTFFYRKVSERVGVKTFAHFGAKTFLTLSYFEVKLISRCRHYPYNLGQYWLKMER